MLNVIQNDLVERELAKAKKTTPICINALQEVLSKTVEIYKNSSLKCNFQELVAACILYLEICVEQAPNLDLSKEMILSAASELEKSCRRCLHHILFEKGTYDLEIESEESGIRLSVLQISSMVGEFYIGKENLLLEKNKTEIEPTFQSLKSQLTIAFDQIIKDSIASLRFIEKCDPELSLLVTSQGHVGYLIGVIARVTKKEVKDFLSFS